MATKSRSAHQGGLYKVYQTQNRQALNRKRKLERALKAAPNNEQIVAALKAIKYRRGTPKTSVWSHTSKAWAQMKKSFAVVPGTKGVKVSEKEMFKLRARAHDREGNLLMKEISCGLLVWTS